MIFAYRNVDSPNGDFGLVKQEGDERFAVLTVEEYAALREADARANTAKVAADLMRARAERAERFLSMLFESHWDGTIGRPPTWLLRGDFRHILAGMRGETLADAIAALSTQRGEG